MKVYVPRHVLTWHPDRLKLAQDAVEGPTSIGYAPVFNTLEELRQYFPSAPYEIWTVNGPQKPVLMDGAAPQPG